MQVPWNTTQQRFLCLAREQEKETGKERQTRTDTDLLDGIHIGATGLWGANGMIVMARRVSIFAQLPRHHHSRGCVRVCVRLYRVACMRMCLVYIGSWEVLKQDYFVYFVHSIYIVICILQALSGRDKRREHS